MSSIILRRKLKARRERRSHHSRPILIALVGLLGLASICAAAGVGSIFAVYNSYAKDYVPIEEKLRQRTVGLTEIYDRGGPDGGVLLGRLTNADAQLLEPIPLDQISPYLVAATVSTEDNSYWDNPGINFGGLARAAYENYVLDKFGTGTGGSSITQQLIKNVYICPNISTLDEQNRCVTAERTLDRKLREIVYAVELTRDYSKDDILDWYLNQISYADRYIGIEAASQGYFHKPAKDLTLAEAALLAGVPQFPTRYHPRSPDNCVANDDGTCALDQLGRTTVAGEAKTRQEAVLDLMVAHGRATTEEAAAAKAEPVNVYQASNPLKAEAWIDNQVEPRLVRMCLAKLLPKLDGAADCETSVHSAGYKVTTTLDYDLSEQARAMANEFVYAGLQAGCECHNAAIVTIEPATGQIIVYAPNIDPTWVSDPRVAGNIDELAEINQPGSSFKPAVYLNFFDSANKVPMSAIWDTSPLAVEGIEIVNPRQNGPSEGLVSARAGLGGSQNVPAFRAATEGGVDNVIAMAQKLGITTLAQHFDPTFSNHDAVTYGASIATGGANIRAIDMAYMDATIANMGKMVGTPSLAQYVKLKDLKNKALDVGSDYDHAKQQSLDFQRGNIRLEGTRELDPIVVLEVRDKDGGIIYREPDPQTRQTVDAGSVWLLHSIMSDCTARFIIWSCGSSNTDTGLDFWSDGVKIPSGIKTGTQQGPLRASDTLETWMTGYSRHAATAVWVGNANNDLVNDRSFAAANTTTKLWKTWMGQFHHELVAKHGVTDIARGFDDIRPANVAQRSFPSPVTDRTISTFTYCDQTVLAWVRTDVKYDSQCEERDIDTRNGLLATEQTPAQFRETKKFVKLPDFKPDAAVALARARGIPIAPTEKSNGQAALAFGNLQNGRTLSTTFEVTGSVNVSGLKSWTLEIGESSNPTEWKTIGTGTANVDNGPLGLIEPKDLKDNTVYTVRLSSGDANGLKVTVIINIKRSGGPGPSTTPPAGNLTPTPTPIPRP